MSVAASFNAPERAALAAAIEAEKAQVAEAETAVTTAQQQAVTHRVAVARGDAGEAPVSVAQARATLLATEEPLDSRQ